MKIEVAMSLKELVCPKYNSHQAYLIRKLKRQLKQAENYEEWKDIALKLDQETGAQEWKYDNCSPYFDAELIS